MYMYMHHIYVYTQYMHSSAPHGMVTTLTEPCSQALPQLFYELCTRVVRMASLQSPLSLLPPYVTYSSISSKQITGKIHPFVPLVYDVIKINFESRHLRNYRMPPDLE